MAGPQTKYEKLARDAAERIEAARAAGQQLTLLPDEPAPGAVDRPKRGQGKALNQMREWLASRGLRMPEEVLAEMAGLASRDDAILTALATTERVLASLEAGATAAKGAPAEATLGQRIQMFQTILTVQLRASEAMLPYGSPKALGGDGAGAQMVQVVVAGGAAPADPAAQARDVTPQAPRIGGRMAPPPMPHEIQQNQPVAQEASDDAE